MTYLDNILKSRDITLPIKVCLVKALVFPVVMHGCESWTIRKLSTKESMLLNCGVGEDLQVLWTARRSNQSILKEISPEYSLEGLMLKLKLQYFGLLRQRTDSLEKTLMLGKIKGRRERGWQRVIWLDGITDDGHEFEQSPGFGEWQGSLLCCSPWGCKESDTAEWLKRRQKCQIIEKVYHHRS